MLDTTSTNASTSSKLTTAIIGPTFSSNTLDSHSTIRYNFNKPQLAFSATSAKLVDDTYRQVVRVVFNDAVIAKATHRFMHISGQMYLGMSAILSVSVSVSVSVTPSKP